MICVDCGEDKQIFREGSCLQCYLKNHEFTHGPDVFTIPFCVHCQSYKYKNLWYTESLQEILTRYIKQHFSISNELKNLSFSITCDDDEKIKNCEVAITGHIDDQIVTETHSFTVRIKKHVCDICSKQFGGYHEAIIQIRPEKKKLSDEKLDDILFFVDDQIISMQQKKHTNLFLADVGREHGGLDFYLSDKQAAYAILKKLQETYGGYITVSSKNVGMKDGKQLYRDTYLLRLLPYDQGDIIKFNDRYFFIEQISKNTVHIIDLEKNEHDIHEAADLEHAVLIGNKDLIKEMIVVNQREDEVQVMDQKSYHLKVLKKPNDLTVDADVIPVLYIDEEHVYLYPNQSKNDK